MSSMVYIRTNFTNTTLYTGVTAHGTLRDGQHRGGQGGRFSSKYKTTKLVWFEEYEDIADAIAREKQIKAGSRAKKLNLINAMNPQWHDLSKDWHA